MPVSFTNRHSPKHSSLISPINRVASRDPWNSCSHSAFSWVKSNGRCFPLAVVTLIGSICCAIWLSTQGAEILGRKDPRIIIIDEIAGFLVAYLPRHLKSYCFAFLTLPRFFLPQLWRSCQG